jgi:hypothetical protein
VPCDTDASNIIAAMGLNCPGEPIVNATISGSPQASGTLAAFGNTTAFSATEGQRYAVLGSGFVADLPMAGGDIFSTACSQDVGNFDPGTNLPAPIRTNNVGNLTCTDDPGLIGTGDCSNTIQEQFEQASSGAFDYTEIRFDTTVPVGVTSFSYDFAFMSYEYPAYYASSAGWSPSNGPATSPLMTTAGPSPSTPASWTTSMPTPPAIPTAPPVPAVPPPSSLAPAWTDTALPVG